MKRTASGSSFPFGDIVSGFLVFLIALPLSLGISVASGFPPLAGIITAIVGGMLSGVLAGAPLTIKGPAAGLIVIAVGTIETLAPLGNGYRLALAVIAISGAIQVILGLLKVGKLREFFPPTVVHGMMAAIGLIIISKQVHVLLGVKPSGKSPLELLVEIPQSLLLLNPKAVLIAGVSLLLLIGMPKVAGQLSKKIPSPLVVVIVATLLAQWLEVGKEGTYQLAGRTYATGKDLLINLPGSLLKAITFPDFSHVFSFSSWKYIIMFALVGSLESLLTVEAIDQIDPHRRQSNPDKDLVAIGVGNLVCGLIGGLPMISEVVRSSANLNNGAQTRWANWFHGLFLLLFVAFFPHWIGQIPLAALAAILVHVGYRLASPKQFKHIWQIGKEQMVVFVTTIVVTLSTDLLIGVASGIVVKWAILWIYGASPASAFKSYLSIKQIAQDVFYVGVGNDAIFSNFLSFKKQFGQIPQGQQVVIDFSKAPIVDCTFMERLYQLQHAYANTGGKIQITGLEQHAPFSAHPLSGRRRTTSIV